MRAGAASPGRTAPVPFPALTAEGLAAAEDGRGGSPSCSHSTLPVSPARAGPCAKPGGVVAPFGTAYHGGTNRSRRIPGSWARCD